MQAIVKGSLFYKRMRCEHLDKLQNEGCRKCGSHKALQLVNLDLIKMLRKPEDLGLAILQESYFLCPSCSLNKASEAVLSPG